MDSMVFLGLDYFRNNDIFFFLGYATQLVGFWFPKQGLNPGYSNESLES